MSSKGFGLQDSGQQPSDPTPNQGTGQQQQHTQRQPLASDTTAMIQVIMTQLNQMSQRMDAQDQRLADQQRQQKYPPPPPPKTPEPVPDPMDTTEGSNNDQDQNSTTTSMDSAMWKILNKEAMAIRQQFSALLTEEVPVTLNGTNHEAWATHILADAKLTASQSCLNESGPSSTMTDVISLKTWSVKNEMIRSRMINSMNSTVKQDIDLDSTDTSAQYIWNRAMRLYGKSKADQRLETSLALRSLQLQDNDYLAYQRQFKHLRTRLNALGHPMIDATYHDFFIGGLGNWQRAFLNSKLDEWRAASRHTITNMDLDDLMEQLTSRARPRIQKPRIPTLKRTRRIPTRRLLIKRQLTPRRTILTTRSSPSLPTRRTPDSKLARTVASAVEAPASGKTLTALRNGGRSVTS